MNKFVERSSRQWGSKLKQMGNVRLSNQPYQSVPFILHFLFIVATSFMNWSSTTRRLAGWLVGSCTQRATRNERPTSIQSHPHEQQRCLGNSAEQHKEKRDTQAQKMPWMEIATGIVALIKRRGLNPVNQFQLQFSFVIRRRWVAICLKGESDSDFLWALVINRKWL